MKKLVVTLMLVTLSLASCGKNNSTNSGATVVATSPISTINADANFQSLQSAVSNSSFSTSNVNFYTEYHFGSLTNTCVTKDGWFGIDYKSCSSSVSNEQTLYHGQIDLNSKKSELNTILSKTVVFQAYSSTYFVLRTNDNYTYVIRTDYPMQANPVYKLNNADGKATQLLYIR